MTKNCMCAEVFARAENFLKIVETESRVGALTNYKCKAQRGKRKGEASQTDSLRYMSQGSLVMLKVHTRNLGTVTVLCLQGRIVNGEKASLRQAMDSQLRTSVVVLDLGRVSAIDASGLGLMLELRQQAESRGMRFKLMNVTKLVSRVLEITRLDSVFEITSGVELWPAISRARLAGAMEFARCA